MILWVCWWHRSRILPPGETNPLRRNTGDPEAAFQAHVARLNEQLDAILGDTTDFNQQLETEQQNLAPQSRLTSGSPKSAHHEPSEGSETASVDVNEFRKQLKAAQHQISLRNEEPNLNHAACDSSVSGTPMAPPKPSEYGSSSTLSAQYIIAASQNVRSATHAPLWRKLPRWRRHSKALLVAGCVLPLVLLLGWGTDSLSQLAGRNSVSPFGEEMDADYGLGSVDSGEPPVQPVLIESQLELTALNLDISDTASSSADTMGSPAQESSARLSSGATESSSSLVGLPEELDSTGADAIATREELPAPNDAEAPPLSAPSVSPSGHSWVRLGAFRNPDHAQSMWLNLESDQSDLLGNLNHEIRRFDREDGGTLHLLQVGPIVTMEAKRLCRNLTEHSVDCLVVHQ